MTAGIYCITNVVTGDRYVGQSIRIEARLKEHQGRLKCNSHLCKPLQAHWNSYGGKSFVFSILELFPAHYRPSEMGIVRTERHWFEHLKPT